MKQLIVTEGKVSGSKTLLTLVVLAVVLRSVLTGIHVGPEDAGITIGDANAAMRNLVDLAWVLGLLYGGRRATDAWRDKPQRPTA